MGIGGATSWAGDLLHVRFAVVPQPRGAGVLSTGPESKSVNILTAITGGKKIFWRPSPGG